MNQALLYYSLFVGIGYSARDLLSDLNNHAWPAN